MKKIKMLMIAVLMGLYGIAQPIKCMMHQIDAIYGGASSSGVSSSEFVSFEVMEDGVELVLGEDGQEFELNKGDIISFSRRSYRPYYEIAPIDEVKTFVMINSSVKGSIFNEYMSGDLHALASAFYRCNNENFTLEVDIPPVQNIQAMP